MGSKILFRRGFRGQVASPAPAPRSKRRPVPVFAQVRFEGRQQRAGRWISASSDARRVPRDRKAALAAGGEEQPCLLRAGRWAGSEGKRQQLERGEGALAARLLAAPPADGAALGEHQGTRGSLMPYFRCHCQQRGGK